MALFAIPAQEAPLAIRALMAVGQADGELDAAERAMLVEAARLFGYEGDPLAVEPIAPEALEGAIADRDDRLHLLQAAIVMALADGEAHADERDVLDRMAVALDVDEAALTVFRRIAEDRPLLARITHMRNMRAQQRDFIAQVGWMGLYRMLRYGTPYLKEEPEVARKYRELGLLPEGTFGRAFWAHIRERGFNFAGEVGGLPEPAMVHDCLHVLAGYDTDQLGELRVLALTAGMKGDPGFGFLVLAMAQFHLGVRIAPVAEPTTGLFDPADTLGALVRGEGMTMDLLEPGWDPWTLFPLPLEEAQRRVGLAAA